MYSSTLKLFPSDVVWWFMTKAVELGVTAGGAAVKGYDGNTVRSKGGQLRWWLEVWLIEKKGAKRKREKHIFSEL